MDNSEGNMDSMPEDKFKKKIFFCKEMSDNFHVIQRQGLMTREHGFPNDLIFSVNGVDDAIVAARASLSSNGLALLSLNDPFNDGELLRFGTALGQPEPEHDPVALPHTSEGVILNLSSLHGRQAKVSDQPFSTDYLRLHTESSRRQAHLQPRFIVLMCLEPGDETTRAQTILVSMDSVVTKLSERARNALARMRYATSAAAPPILRNSANRPILSFRDFGEDPLEWTCVSDRAVVSEETGTAALHELLDALYTGDGWIGVTWQRGYLLVIDNMRQFHGRSLAGEQPVGECRLLKRLRLLDYV